MFNHCNAYLVEFEGYPEGAVPSAEVKDVHNVKGNLIVESKAGNFYNCHPRYGSDEYPVRWELSEYDKKEMGL
jgi:hypothetical protein